MHSNIDHVCPPHSFWAGAAPIRKGATMRRERLESKFEKACFFSDRRTTDRFFTFKNIFEIVVTPKNAFACFVDLPKPKKTLVRQTLRVLQEYLLDNWSLAWVFLPIGCLHEPNIRAQVCHYKMSETK